MMRRVMPFPVELRVRDSAGSLQELSRPLRPGPDGTLVVTAKPESRFYWTYGVVQQGSGQPVVRLSDPQLFQGTADIREAANLKGPGTIWIAISAQPFSTEKILFDGFSFVSQDEKIRIMPFFAVF